MTVNLPEPLTSERIHLIRNDTLGAAWQWLATAIVASLGALALQLAPQAGSSGWLVPVALGAAAFSHYKASVIFKVVREWLDREMNQEEKRLLDELIPFVPELALHLDALQRQNRPLLRYEFLRVTRVLTPYLQQLARQYQDAKG